MKERSMQEDSFQDKITSLELKYENRCVELQQQIEVDKRNWKQID